MDDATLEERIRMAVAKVNDVLKRQIDDAVLDYNNLVNNNNKLLAEKFGVNNEEIKKMVEHKTAEMRIKILDERRKLDTIVEGRCQAYTIEVERKLAIRLGTAISETEALKEEVLGRLDKS